MTDVRILERLPTVTLFGTRLFDPLSGEVLAGGFDVTLRQDHGARLGSACSNPRKPGRRWNV